MIYEFFRGFTILIIYFIVAASTALVLRHFLKPSREGMRKLLHIIAVLSVFVYLHAFKTYFIAAGAAAAFALLVYPILYVVERQFPKIMRKLSERKNGEFKSSLMILKLMFILLILIFWGGLGERGKPIIIGAVMAWGLGDAAAALVGKAYGKRRVKGRFVDNKKTHEGTTAMLVVSFAAVFVSLLCYTSFDWYFCLAIAAVTAPVCALVELISSGGMDTITVPLSASFLIYGLIRLIAACGGIII